MDLFVTYCSADKDPAPGRVPALQRYRSERIMAVHDAAVLSGREFRILSGKFGLLAADEPIADYDHLLTADEVASHAECVAEQLERIKPDRVFFFTRSLLEDAAVGPYDACLQAACLSFGVRRILIEIPPENAGAFALVNLAESCGPDTPTT